ncbi:MAG TPA: hypothetical protein VHW74_00050 [Mycobacteriales bacterium]|jgi:hypothetical protein|nr:hypothetical protein [Mycobacteriales bacterium]
MTTQTTRAQRGGEPRHEAQRGGEPRRETLLTDFTLAPLSPEEKRRAALTVCQGSETVAEARELLSALGLLEDSAIRGAA